MASISTLGIGSGLDLSTLLDKLTTAEQAQLTPITTQQTAYNAKLTAYSTTKSALTAFQTANTALANSKLYQSTSATSSAPSSFTATTDTGATAGNYSIAVSQLAQAQSLTSAKYSSTSSNIGTSGASNRTLSISLAGSSSPVNISLSDSQTTLTGVRDAINGANAGVNASIIQVDSGSYQLVLTSASTGTSNGITISVSGDDTLQSALGYDAVVVMA
ncbi:MAG: Flagellar hook-associated protein 2 [Candidatus Erwinia impunctatus]|nr:Flagellar hook-associated protein 2 [Culicoides impunctatus]